MTEPVLSALLEERTRVDRAIADLGEREAQLSTLLGGLSELGTRRRDGSVETLEGVEQVRAWIARSQGEVTTESLACVPGGAQAADSLAAAAPLDEALLAQGVQLRTIYATSAANDLVTRRHVTRMTALGEQVRTVPRVPMRMLVTDRRMALVPIDPADTMRGAVVVRTPGIVRAFVSLFESYWAVGVPFGAGRTADAGLTPHERSVVEALAAGLRDEEIAEQLAVSVRTVRRTVAALMERLAAQSRFGAGVAAVRAGWLPDD